MITRFAVFEGVVRPGATEEFRQAVIEKLLPKWQAFPGALAVRVCFTEECDDDAPAFPMIMEIDYPDRAAVATALASPARTAAKAATEEVLAGFFEGHIHHHVTTARTAPPTG